MFFRVRSPAPPLFTPNKYRYEIRKTVPRLCQIGVLGVCSIYGNDHNSCPMWITDRKPPMDQTVLIRYDGKIYAACRHTPEFCWAFTGEYENLIMDINLIESWKSIED